MPTATMTTNGRITVPADMRAKLQLVPGSKLDFVEQPDGSFEIRTNMGGIQQCSGVVEQHDPLESIGATISGDFKRSAS
jgi:antitoxin PrlF